MYRCTLLIPTDPMKHIKLIGAQNFMAEHGNINIEAMIGK